MLNKQDAGNYMPAGTMEPDDRSRSMPQGMSPGYGGAGEAAGMRRPESGMGEVMPSGSMAAGNTATDNEPRSVLVEVRVPAATGTASVMSMVAGMNLPGVQVDADYEPVPMTPPPDQRSAIADAGEQTVILRARVAPEKIRELEAQPNVVKVWNDTRIEPFQLVFEEDPEAPALAPMDGFGPCPIGTCDCDFSTPKGTIADVATYLGVNQIWADGIRGDGIVVGVVDGGVTAAGRPINSADTSNPKWPNKLIPRVIGGWPVADWGTTGVGWNWHGNMCSTDVLGMAPNAQIYDIRVGAASSAATISNALAGFTWAINQHKANGTPQVLTNSWGIYQEVWDSVYARDPNHPFTRKVIEALDEGILVLFAAGNCGNTCPDGRCGSDSGPGRSIWGANGHPRVMTVAAVNKNEQYVGYSSQGPAALDPNKPDFCSVTHFTGFTNCDNGTSAATPIAAGVVALLKQANPFTTQDGVKAALRNTAKDIGPAGFDQYSGAGIIRAKLAYDLVSARPRVSGPVVSWGPNRLDAFVIGTDSGMYHKWWNGGAWGPSLTGYENMSGIIEGEPEVVAWGPNRLDAFVIGSNRGLYHKAWNGSAWAPSVTGYEYLGGVIRSRPKAVAWGSNRLDIFVIGMDGALYHKYWNGSAWGPSPTGYEYMSGFIQGDPEAVAWGPNRLDIFVVGGNHGLYHKWWNGAAWGPSLTGYEFMGGVISGNPKAVAWGPNRLDVFVIGTDSALYYKWWNGSAWGPSLTGYEYMGGTIVGSPAVVSWGPNRLDVFVIGTDSALYHKAWNGSAWSPSLTGWENLGGTIIGEPRVVSWGPNRLDIFVRGTDSAMYHKWWDGSNWGPSMTGYEYMGGTVIAFSPEEKMAAAAM